MVQFIRYITVKHGGTRNLAALCKKKNISLNLGSPPFICLIPFKQPSPTLASLAIVKWGPIMLLCVKIATFAVDIIYYILDYHPSGMYLEVDNIHYILHIPAGSYDNNIFKMIKSFCIPKNSVQAQFPLRKRNTIVPKI